MTVASVVPLGTSAMLDAWEAVVVARNLPQAATRLVHRFTPGLYIRELTVPAGVVVTTAIHKTEHPFVISKGEVSVYTEDAGWVRLAAPYTGITQAGTRRLAIVHQETTWTTFHVTGSTDPEEIEREVTEEYDHGWMARALPPEDVG